MARKKQMDMGPVNLFADRADEPDIWINGTNTVQALHYDHSDPLMRKPFIMWDGEGYTDEFGQHHYWLLANSAGDKIVAPPGRSLNRFTIARLFMETRALFPDAIHVGFALGYDFTCIIRGNGIEKSSLTTLKDKQYLQADGYIWKLRAGKTLLVHEEGYVGQKESMTLQDTWGFFQRTFVKALDEYFDEDWPYRDIIIRMKKERGNFDREHDEEVMQYNDMELELGVKLMEELRDRLFAASMPIRNWYGPGAIASGLMEKWKIKKTQVDLYTENPAVAVAAQHSYAGGRFELFKCGHVGASTFQYDINSAYPWAIAQLPNWKNGQWIHHKGGKVDELTEYSMARIIWDNSFQMDNLAPGNDVDIFPESIPFPFWRRDPQGNISYPSSGIHGWYWSCEVLAGAKYLDSLPDYYDKIIQIQEWWEYIPATNEKPFNQVPVMYKTRQELKRKGNGAHIGLKLGLNSLYGKLAQQIGWSEENDRKPPFHNLAAAGYVTAKCRARLLEGIALDPSAIIAVETDGIFSTRELAVPITTEMGDWEFTEYEDMWYWQSGFRFGIKGGEVIKPATRGIPVADITLSRIREQITNSESTMRVDTTTFVTLGLALHRNKPEIAGNWIVKKGQDGKELVLMCEDIQGKRIHEPHCPQCTVGNDSDMRIYHWDGLHLTFPRPGNEFELSNPHKVLWNTGDTISRDVFEHEIDGIEF